MQVSSQYDGHISDHRWAFLGQLSTSTHTGVVSYLEHCVPIVEYHIQEKTGRNHTRQLNASADTQLTAYMNVLSMEQGGGDEVRNEYREITRRKPLGCQLTLSTFRLGTL